MSKEETDVQSAEQEATNTSLQRLSCRMYENKYPEVDDLVMVNVKQIAEMGAYVHLMEYNNIEGMILLSELSRRRIRSIQKLIRVGRNEVVVVMRVDKEKGYIDLSKRRVSPEDLAKCEEKFTKSKAVHSIMRHVSEKSNIVLEDLYSQVGWPLARKHGHIYEAFKIAIRLFINCDFIQSDPDSIFNEFNMSHEVKRELINNVKKRMTPQPVKIRADLECTCFGYEGIDAIKAALKAGEDCSNNEILIKIRLVAPPLYVMTTNTLDKALGIETLEKAIQKIEEILKTQVIRDGLLTIKMKPKAVSDADDLKLAILMEQAEKENEEVSGDEEEDEDELEKANTKDDDSESEAEGME